MRLQSISSQISKSSFISVYVLMPTPEGRETCAIMTRAIPNKRSRRLCRVAWRAYTGHVTTRRVTIFIFRSEFLSYRGRGSPGRPADEQFFVPRNLPCPVAAGYAESLRNNAQFFVVYDGPLRSVSESVIARPLAAASAALSPLPGYAFRTSKSPRG